MSVLDERPVVPAESPAAPRSWSFTDSASGIRRAVTCMPGCQMDHSGDIESPTHPDDIWCQKLYADVCLPVNDSGTPEEVRVLGVTLNVRPFDRQLAQRLPHVDVELMEDAWIEGLDPDGLETAIGTLQARLELLRRVHGEMVTARAEYRAVSS